MKVAGTVRVPGDKSISHRALMLAALTRGGGGGGRCELPGLLTGEDVKSTARVLRRMGAVVSTVREGVVVTVRGGRFSRPGGSLDCGNSGTTARLTLGLLAGQRFPARLTGDAGVTARYKKLVNWSPLTRLWMLAGEGVGLFKEMNGHSATHLACTTFAT